MAKKLNNTELVFALLNKQLEQLSFTMNDVKNIPCWFDEFVTSKEENEKWLEWGVDFIIKNAKKAHLRNKKTATKEMNMLNLSFGLRIDNGVRKRILLTEKKKQPYL